MVLTSMRFDKDTIDRVQRKMEFYNCDEGEREIFNLCVDARLFEQITPEQLPLRNYAIAKLTELGFNQEDKIRKIIHEMLQMPAVLDREHKETSDGND